jgi:hypothetical protein
VKKPRGTETKPRARKRRPLSSEARIFLKNLHSIARIKTSREKEFFLRRERRERASE